MTAYAEGDQHAFSRLFGQLAPRIHGFFHRSFRDSAVCSDLLQDTFLRVHKARRTYRAGLPLRPWVFAIAARIRQDELRRRYRLREDAGEEALALAEEAQSIERAQDTERDRFVGDLTERLRAALDRLPESQRVVIHLHRYEGMTLAQIAAVLGTSEVSVRGRAFRAYVQLRKQLHHLFNGGDEP